MIRHDQPEPLSDQIERLDDLEVGDSLIWRPVIRTPLIPILTELAKTKGKAFNCQSAGDSTILVTRKI